MTGARSPRPPSRVASCILGRIVTRSWHGVEKHQEQPSGVRGARDARSLGGPRAHVVRRIPGRHQPQRGPPPARAGQGCEQRGRTLGARARPRRAHAVDGVHPDRRPRHERATTGSGADRRCRAGALLGFGAEKTRSAARAHADRQRGPRHRQQRKRAACRRHAAADVAERGADVGCGGRGAALGRSARDPDDDRSGPRAVAAQRAPGRTVGGARPQGHRTAIAQRRGSLERGGRGAGHRRHAPGQHPGCGCRARAHRSANVDPLAWTEHGADALCRLPAARSGRRRGTADVAADRGRGAARTGGGVRGVARSGQDVRAPGDGAYPVAWAWWRTGWGVRSSRRLPR